MLKKQASGSLWATLTKGSGDCRDKRPTMNGQAVEIYVDLET